MGILDIDSTPPEPKVKGSSKANNKKNEENVADSEQISEDVDVSENKGEEE